MLKRREFLTSMCGLGVAALAPWALFAESREVGWRAWHAAAVVNDKFQLWDATDIVTGTTIIPFDYDLHRFGDFDGFGDGLWVEV